MAIEQITEAAINKLNQESIILWLFVALFVAVLAGIWFIGRWAMKELVEALNGNTKALNAVAENQTASTKAWEATSHAVQELVTQTAVQSNTVSSLKDVINGAFRKNTKS